jgi:hypothetical protein
MALFRAKAALDACRAELMEAGYESRIEPTTTDRDKVQWVA